MQMDPSQLAALSAVLRLGAFEAAAHALSVTPSAISQRIKALEDRTGTALVLRGSPCTGTAAGLRIAKHAEDIGLLEAQLARELSLEADHGPVRLRIAVNADSLASWFIGAMAAVDGVLFDLLVDDQDHSAEWLKRGEVSAAVTASSKPVTGFEAYPLGTLDYAATASPEFMARWFAQGVTPEAAAKAPCMIFNAKDNLQRLWLERNVAPGLSPPAHFLPSTQAFIDAAAAGLGWGMNPLPMVAEDIRSGRLVPLIAGSTLPVPLTWQVARVMAPALAEVTRAVQKSARQYLTQN
ncbi:LysR family transcriptional regulator ArgP [Leisingera daeponensis]|uniref:LysR family transcriptional regulator ArgP n=1 Tax=Leisingera daeponensis TaxID=405746 RepID=UPI00040DEE66|nr:LysR family transcriptional regulator ArgP [Leisingera daeponensis]